MSRSPTASTPSVAFSFTAGARVGAGHLSRCIAIAAALRRLGAHTTAIVGGRESVSPGAGQFDDEVDNSAFAARDFQVVVEDHAPGVGALAPRPARVVVMDDGPPRAIDASIVLNPNLGAQASGYRPRPGGVVLAGAEYALVGEDVLRARRRYEAGVVPRVVTITCGAADPGLASEWLLDALAPLIDRVEVRLMIGQFNRRRTALVAAAESLGVVAITDTSVPACVIDTDLAVTTLGVTATELACIGVPNLAVAQTDVQMEFLASYEDLGVLRGAGRLGEVSKWSVSDLAAALLRDAPTRTRMSSSGRALVDGEGADRVAIEILDLARRPLRESSDQRSR